MAHLRRGTVDMANRSAVGTVLTAGAVCGVLDISAAIITYAVKGVRPISLLQGIAAPLLGPETFQEGLRSALLGLSIHFFIAFVAAALFFLVSRRSLWLLRHPIEAGIYYGFGVYAVMYWIVLRLLGSKPQHLGATLIAIATHIVCVGLPISLITSSLQRRPMHKT
jgi:hypothetical protein